MRIRFQAIASPTMAHISIQRHHTHPAASLMHHSPESTS